MVNLDRAVVALVVVAAAGVRAIVAQWHFSLVPHFRTSWVDLARFVVVMMRWCWNSAVSWRTPWREMPDDSDSSLSHGVTIDFSISVVVVVVVGSWWRFGERPH